VVESSAVLGRARNALHDLFRKCAGAEIPVEVPGARGGLLQRAVNRGFNRLGAAVICGPMPSPGNTRSLIAVSGQPSVVSQRTNFPLIAERLLRMWRAKL
jgi:hypothetical protein